MSVSEGRTLLIFEELPPRKTVLNRAQIDTDVREAMAKAERRIRDVASTYHVRGWHDVGDIEYKHPQKGLISAKLRLER